MREAQLKKIIDSLVRQSEEQQAKAAERLAQNNKEGVVVHAVACLVLSSLGKALLESTIE